MDLEQRIDIVVDRIQEIVENYKQKAVYALFSGGDDSLVMAYLASHHPLFKGVIFANTLTGDKETVEYVRKTSKTMGWNYYETKPDIHNRYPAILATRGVPNPQMHAEVFGRLKGKPWDKMRTQLARKNKCKRTEILFVTGIRKAESTKRMQTVTLEKVYLNKNGSLRSVWGAPICDLQRSDLEDVFAQAKDLSRNMHAYKFGASRECGCKATEGTQDPILEKQFYPLYYERRRLQYKLAQIAYELQEFEVENGFIDRDEATIPTLGIRDINKPLQKELFEYRYEGDTVDGTPFLCVGCENKAGEDIDKELWVTKQHKISA